MATSEDRRWPHAKTPTWPLTSVDAIGDFAKQEGFCRPLIVGYDGIKSVRRSIHERSDTVAAVVLQDTHELAVTGVRALRNMTLPEGRADTSRFLQPLLYPEFRGVSERDD
jgi:hypothetical protein